jgi:Right handed beta helix region
LRFPRARTSVSGTGSAKLFGSGVCDSKPSSIYPTCAVLVDQPFTEWAGVAIVGDPGAAAGFVVTSTDVTLSKVSAEEFGWGSVVYGRAAILNSTFSGNYNGLNVGTQGSGVVTMNGTVVKENRRWGLYCSGDGEVKSKGSSFSRNGEQGLAIIHNCRLESTGDIVVDNGGSGVTFGESGSISAAISSATIRGNTKDGISVTQVGASIRVRDSEILGNGGFGLMQASTGPGAIDLGTDGAPGNNVFGRGAARNSAGAICNSLSQGFHAAGNSFGRCPAVFSQNCSNSPDYGGQVFPGTAPCKL